MLVYVLCLACFGVATMDIDVADQGEEVISPFAENVLMHVVLHEMGHGLIREFDLPILGNEETMADAFATVYLTRHMPDRAFDVLKARTESLMIEAKEIPRAEWTVEGEHNSDARRAYQVAALAVAADREKYRPIAELVGMSDDEISSAVDYGAEIHRSWRRILRPLLMPDGEASSETRIRFDPSSNLVSTMQASRLVKEVEAALKRFDWHSQVTVFFIQGDGGAGWNRSRRTVSVTTSYIRRFNRQGAELHSEPKK